VGPWDALSAGPLAGTLGSALLLTEPAAPPAATAAWHVGAANTLSKIYAVGGTSVISDAAATAAVGAATPTAPLAPTGALKLTNVTQASLALRALTSTIGATLSANASGTYKGVLGNGIGVTLAAGPAGTLGFSAVVTTSAGSLDSATGARILVLGPNLGSFDSMTMGQLAAAINATGQFTLSLTAATGAELVTTSVSSGTISVASPTSFHYSSGVNLVGGSTSAQLTLTFNTAATSVSGVSSELIHPKAGSAGNTAIADLQWPSNTMTCSITARTCTTAQLTTVTAPQVLALIGTTGNVPELRLPVGRFVNFAGTEVPAATIPLTIS
jgi:hypothetical protein